MEEAKTQTRPWLVRVNLQELGVGLCLVWLGFFMPVFFTVGNFHILDTLYFALDHGEKTGLMLAALKLVALNSLRGIPHYIGAFLIAESVEYRWKEHNLWAVNALMVIVVLLCTYRSIDALHRVHYDFGLPADDVVSYKGVKSNDNGDAGLVLVVEAASGKAQDVVTALESYKQDQVAFYGNYAEFAQAQSNVENAIISSKGDRVVMVIASNECTADLNSAVDSALNS